MPPISSSQKAAQALRRVEAVLRNWQDDPNSPRRDVDQMLASIAKMRDLVQGHVYADLELTHEAIKQKYQSKSGEAPTSANDQASA